MSQLNPKKLTACSIDVRNISTYPEASVEFKLLVGSAARLLFSDTPPGVSLSQKKYNSWLLVAARQLRIRFNFSAKTTYRHIA